MTFSKAWLEKKIMCGLCNFGCCNHPSFHVEITEEEQKFYQKEYGLDLELEWKQDGCCKLLEDDNTGCSLGDDRPLFCKLYNKNVKTIYSVALSNYVYKNKKMWYDRLRDRHKFDGDFKVVQSDYPYQYKLKLDESLPLDQTYEAKAWDWMVKNIEPSEKVLFWDVGIKEYDLSYIEPIKWHKSEYEQIIDREMRRKSKVTEHDFF